MRNCIILDFDGTITTQDTTKILLLELLKISPWRLFFLLRSLVVMFLSSESSRRQLYKNKMIGSLISGYKIEQLQSALVRFEKKVNPLYRKFLLKKIRISDLNGDLVIVATASPKFAISFCMANLPVIVVGTEFKKIGAFYSGELDGTNCYGESKVNKIENLVRDASFQINIKETWSDDFSDYPMMKMAKQRYWIGDYYLEKQVHEKDPDGHFILDQ